MAAFEYSALDARGKRHKGVLEGDSARQIRQLLRDRGLVPLQVEAAAQRSALAAKSSLSFGSRRLSNLERVLITRQLATLIGAGLPIEEALAAVAGQSEKQHLSALVMGVRSRVLEGRSLAASLADFPSSFSPLYRSTVAAGERSGYLDKALDNLADYMERQFEARRNVEMALFYPVVLFALALLIVGALMVYVVPDMVRVLENMGQELPAITRFLIAASAFVQAWWWALLLAAGGAGFGMRAFLRQPAVRLAWDRRKLGLPLVRRIARSSSAARYANTLSILNGSGVPLVEAMRIAGEVVSNTWLKRRLADAAQRVSEGSSLRAGLERVGHFPPMLLHMVASGESSGELDAMLQRVASHQQAEVERIVAAMVTLLQPLMLLLMGALVMFIVMAILLPILNMNQLL